MWLQIKKNGVYYTNENLSQLLHPRDHLLEDEFTKAYCWMAEQMQERISLPPKSVTVPIWCWYAQDKHVAPHNRYYSNQACIELELPANKILLSDFDLWHVVLMDGFVLPDDMDSEKYSKVDDRIEALPELEKRKIIEQSWQHIFDIKKDGQWIQGCIWQINYDDVIKVYHHHDNHQLKIFTPKRKIFD